ncbi:protein gp37 [Limimonas halophila]|uniref:Protein gp37 n=1 Tax=Limimonas halophila TaxID=1082479 RepID=A0A1G7PN82_9PROT|nr:phage Gp37/Gp68 family protein [Limimonas halophila]SDF87882.1 protein gp37 [Limimonas halophila]
MTLIEWTEATWNPIVGCSLVSPGCTNCYAMRQAVRLSRNPATPQYHGTVTSSKAGPVWTGRVNIAGDSVVRAPLRRRKATAWFVNSMGDLFHENIPTAWIDHIFAVMALAPQHVFQVLTKRPVNMRAYMRDPEAPGRVAQAMAAEGGEGTQPPWPPRNVWLGTSAEDQARASERIPDLLATPAAIRFLSCEPLLGALDLAGLDALGPGEPRVHWVIAGGESGPHARPLHPAWPRGLRDQCAASGAAFFFKQWGVWRPPDPGETGERRAVAADGRSWPDGAAPEGVDTAPVVRLSKARAGRALDGADWSQIPGA